MRALLDFYKEPDLRVLGARQKTHEELKLQEVGCTKCVAVSIFTYSRRQLQLLRNAVTGSKHASVGWHEGVWLAEC